MYGPSVALIGDVIESTGFEDQRSLFTSIEQALCKVNGAVPAQQPLRMSVGDEFQGLYPNVAAALKAGLLVRLRLYGVCELRIGMGRGRIEMMDPESVPFRQSGPGWWAARDAMNEVRALESKQKWPRSLRCRFRSGTDDGTGIINAFLLAQDQILSRMDERDARITIGLFEGEQQRKIATDLGVTQPSVASRQMENGPITLYRAILELERAIA